MIDHAEFCAALLDPARAVPAPLRDPRGGPAGARFAVYRNNVAVGLIEALRVGFPMLERLLGAEFFGAMAAIHLRRHPPRSALLDRYGTEMPGFLADFAPLAHLPWLADVARLELALRDSYHAADAAPVAPEILRALSPGRLMASRMILAPAVRLVPSDWPLHALWLAHHDPGCAPPPGRAGAQPVLVTRPCHDPAPHPLPTGAVPFIAGLMAGLPLAAALAEAPSFDFEATFALLIGTGAVAAIEPGEGR